MTLPKQVEREFYAIADACEARDKRALYAAFAQSLQRVNPDEPIDLSRVRACARCYAAQIFGWEVDGA